MKRKPALVKSTSLPATGAKGLLAEVREIILAARQSIATTANAALTRLQYEALQRSAYARMPKSDADA